MDDRQVQSGLSNANPSRSSNIAGVPPRPVDLGCLAENAFTRNGPEVPAIEAVSSIVAEDEVTFVRDDIIATVGARENHTGYFEVGSRQRCGRIECLAVENEPALFDLDCFSGQSGNALHPKLSLRDVPPVPLLGSEHNHVAALGPAEPVKRRAGQKRYRPVVSSAAYSVWAS